MPDVEVDGLRLHYREAGDGPPVLLLHGWPTSSFLYRDIMPLLAVRNRVLALDLPGFGDSDKPLDRSYSFRFFASMIDGFLEATGVEQTGLVVHDLGGPVGLYWAVQHLERVTALALLNTLVYPELSLAAKAFLVGCRLPGIRGALASPTGLGLAMRLGMQTPPSDEVVAAVQRPFGPRDARRALVATACNLHPAGLMEIARRLPGYQGPVRLIYGAHDRILPDVAETMARVARDLPQAEITALAGCGHFLQEDDPELVGRLLAEFFEMAGGT